MEDVNKKLDEMIDDQQKKLLIMAREFSPQLTRDDLLQPMDFPELEANPLFRYEEGVLAGMLMVQTVLNSQRREVR